MRCQKARSYLSAYCNNELTGAVQVEVSEHLASCSDCRQEEASYRSITQAVGTLNKSKLSADFNAKLLNRVAQERFAETRTAAYLPRTSVRVFNRGLVPAFVTSAMVLLAVGIVFSPKFSPIGSGQFASNNNGQLDDSYLTAQPVGNPNFTDPISKEWSLSNQLARSQRYDQLSSSVAPTWASFASASRPNIHPSGVTILFQSPFGTMNFQARPIIRQYGLPNGGYLTSGGATNY